MRRASATAIKISSVPLFHGEVRNFMLIPKHEAKRKVSPLYPPSPGKGGGIKEMREQFQNLICHQFSYLPACLVPIIFPIPILIIKLIRKRYEFGDNLLKRYKTYNKV